jgi:hypothetical protein
LSGAKLSILYLHTAGRETIERFNTEFVSKLGLDERAKLPCVVFFRLVGEEFTDIEVAVLESADLIHGFHELYRVIEVYLDSERQVSVPSLKSIRWTKGALQFVSKEFVQEALKAAFRNFF